MQISNNIKRLLNTRICFGKNLALVPENTIVFFPYTSTTFACGLAGIAAFKKAGKKIQIDNQQSFKTMVSMTEKLEANTYKLCMDNKLSLEDHYLGGKKLISDLWKISKDLKKQDSFYDLFKNKKLQKDFLALSERLQGILQKENQLFSRNIGHLSSSSTKAVLSRIENLKDLVWCLKIEVLDNIKKIKSLTINGDPFPPYAVNMFQRLNAVLNSIDRLEVRGRDSAGISLLFIVKSNIFEKFENRIKIKGLDEELKQRTCQNILINKNITISKPNKDIAALGFTYKIAAEIGRLGDNIDFIRNEIKNDPLLHTFINFPYEYHTISAHTRWASVGAISEANCHPQDGRSGIIHVCLNGDIDNYLDLKAEIEKKIGPFPDSVTTDTKIIPLQIEKYFKKGLPISEAIRLAVNDFKGSHAISIHTDLAPGKIFLAQKGSGQTVFVGLGDEHYMPTSEVYGFIEETSSFLKMDGEKRVEGVNGFTQGQFFVLNQDSKGGLEGIKACYYDGTPINLSQDDIKTTEITSRDIDRQQFPHYFLKEISESPASVEKTLHNRWKIKKINGQQQMTAVLDHKSFPDSLKDAFLQKKIRRICFVGQGTAGVACLASAEILNYYLNDTDIHISAQKASEFSGFMINDDLENSLSDTLVIAVSQSGTTTDTNRTVDMVSRKGAHTLAIVNRRDSDITFKVDGVIYTSSGRDIEMSVASTKAFYSQIVAGALLGLYLTEITKKRDADFITDEMQQLLNLPNQMRKVLEQKEKIGKSAKKLATTKTYWAVVGSGPNKAAADEIRIKLSELCYKTISSDFVEDKKHIDLSSEPLIIICAAGTRQSVLSDIIKDTAIFKAHKSLPVAIVDEDEEGFNPYVDDIIHVPAIKQHLAPVLNTLAGHLWGYNAALAINEGSHFLFKFREEIKSALDSYVNQGLDLYEILLERSFQEKIARFSCEFMQRKRERRFPSIMGLNAVTDLTLLLKYLSGRLPVADFELDFRLKGTPSNMIESLFTCLGDSINNLARPVDAIKHQAKTVTVGTSRISEKMKGILFDAAQKYYPLSQITATNVLVLKNLQEVIDRIVGLTLYKISGLNLLGEPTEDSYIKIIERAGTSKDLPSSVDSDIALKGIKRIIIQNKNVFIGKGRKDDRSILVIPIMSDSPARANMIEHLLLLNITFKKEVKLSVKVKALGGKCDHIKNIVQESSIVWQDSYLDLMEIEELFGQSAEKIAEFIVEKVKTI
ncbi:glutamine---fructose-6-phosphate transaminase (isomerizing) [Candidatus Magnetomoraceae bacterium gMMP-1]